MIENFNLFTYEPCPFESGLRKFALDFVVVIFFKNAEKITNGGLILSLVVRAINSKLLGTKILEVSKTFRV